MESLLTGLGTFRRLNATRDDHRGPVTQYDEDDSVLYEDVRIRVDDLGGDQQFELAQMGINATHVVYCLGLDDLRNGDVLDTEGVRYRVTNIRLLRAIGSLPDHMEIYVKEFAP